MEKNESPGKDIIIRGMWNNAHPYLRVAGKEVFGGVTKDIVRRIHKDSADKAEEIAANVFDYGVMLSANAIDYIREIKGSKQRFGEFLEGVEPYLIEEFNKSGISQLMRSKNEVIQVECERLMGLTKYGFFGATVGLADKAPDLYAKLEENESGKVSGAILGKFDELKGSMKLEESTTQLFNIGVRSGVPALMQYVREEGETRFGTVSAYQLIANLAQQAEENPDLMRVVGHPIEGQMPLHEYIFEVFKQHQLDIGKMPINERFRYLPELEAACKQIANEIEHNLLNPMALVTLVGGRKVLDEHLRVTPPEQLAQEFSRIWRAIEKAEKIDTEEFIAETAFAAKEEFQATLEKIPAEHKAFFVSLFPVKVLKEVGGMKEQEIDELKDKGAAEFASHMARAIDTLARMSEEELQRYGLTEEEGRMMRQLSEALDVIGAEEVIEGLQGQARKDVVKAVGNARGYWQDLIEKESSRTRDAEKDAGAEAGSGILGKFTTLVSRNPDSREQERGA